MSEIKLDRHQRRQMKKLSEQVDKVTQADRRFFERFPHRQHRVRVASVAEIAQNEVLVGDMSLPPPQQHFVVVRNIAPGCRLRKTVIGPKHAETDLSESEARSIYEAVETNESRLVEAQMRKAMEARS